MSELNFKGKYWTFDKSVALVYEKRDLRYLGAVSFMHEGQAQLEETEWDVNGDNIDRKEWGLNSKVLSKAAY